jgi:hypothetical protein
MANPVTRQVKSADPAILASALVVGGIWGYRRLVEPAGQVASTGFSAKSVAGLAGAPAAAAEFIPAFAFVYITLALVGMAEPDAARSFALLVAIGDVLTNGAALFGDIGGQVTGTTTATAGSSSSSGGLSLPSGPVAPAPSTVHQALLDTVTGQGVYVTPSGRLTSKAPTGAAANPSGTVVAATATAQGLVYDPSIGQYVKG